MWARGVVLGLSWGLRLPSCLSLPWGGSVLRVRVILLIFTKGLCKNINRGCRRASCKPSRLFVSTSTNVQRPNVPLSPAITLARVNYFFSLSLFFFLSLFIKILSYRILGVLATKPCSGLSLAGGACLPDRRGWRVGVHESELCGRPCLPSKFPRRRRKPLVLPCGPAWRRVLCAGSGA